MVASSPTVDSFPIALRVTEVPFPSRVPVPTKTGPNSLEPSALNPDPAILPLHSAPLMVMFWPRLSARSTFAWNRSLGRPMSFQYPYRGEAQRHLALLQQVREQVLGEVVFCSRGVCGPVPPVPGRMFRRL